ncbi:MAG TPA: zinc ribbon domain-containing protein [Firmicutes bacterium]|nr:zinc ribbon domain-containing protein [Bacillota bacterium]
MFCTKCGKNNPDGASFCMKCGSSLLKTIDTEINYDSGLEMNEEKQRKKANIQGILIFIAIFSFIPILLILQFFYPIAVGYVWLVLMVAVTLKAKPKKKGLSFLVLGILCFLALMATVTDMCGNPGSNYIFKKLYLEENEDLIVEKVVTHPEPGVTNLSYHKYRVTPNGEKLMIRTEMNLFSNAIFYFSIAVILTVLNLIINLFRHDDVPGFPHSGDIYGPNPPYNYGK